MMGTLHPMGALYERPINLSESKAQHADFRRKIRRYGCRVLSLQEILRTGCDWSSRARVELERFALSRLNYTLDPATDESLISKEIAYAISDTYKKTVIEAMDTGQLIDTVFTNPTVQVPSWGPRPFHFTWGCFRMPCSADFRSRASCIGAASLEAALRMGSSLARMLYLPAPHRFPSPR